jgi:hypothetical protein
MLIFSIILILVLVYNTIYTFLPSSVQGMKWIKFIAVLAAISILLYGVKQTIDEYSNLRIAYVSAKNGEILRKKNFPWKITKTTTGEQHIVFIIDERYGDASQVRVVLDEPNCKYEIYNAIDGVGIKFLCPENTIPNFKIIIKD